MPHICGQPQSQKTYLDGFTFYYYHDDDDNKSDNVNVMTNVRIYHSSDEDRWTHPSQCNIIGAIKETTWQQVTVGVHLHRTNIIHVPMHFAVHMYYMRICLGCLVVDPKDGAGDGCWGGGGWVEGVRGGGGVGGVGVGGGGGGGGGGAGSIHYCELLRLRRCCRYIVSSRPLVANDRFIRLVFGKMSRKITSFFRRYCIKSIVFVCSSIIIPTGRLNER